jgi:acyl-CoA synthetase (AMP-forming)/AMP-acid ligase II
MTPELILSAVDNYRGTIFDLDQSLVVAPERFAAGWRGLSRRMGDEGLAAPERVIVAVGNGPLFIAAWAAILSQGGSPLLMHVETPPAEMKRVAHRFCARFVVTDAQVERDLESVGARATTFSVADWAHVVWGDFGDVTTPSGPSMLELSGVPLHPTSGTTGQYKVAVRPAACAVAEVTDYVETIGVDAHDTLLALAPMSHAYAHGWCVVTPMITGANLVTMRRSSAKMVFQACKEHRITILPAVASMLDTLMFGAGKRLYAPERRVITGGAPLSERTAKNFEKASGTRVQPLFGTTETGAIAVARPDGPMAIEGYIGPPFKNVAVQIRPPDDPAEFGPGIGLVHVRSPSVMVGYLSDETLDTSVVADGWFNTGDLGSLDADGALRLCGRQAEVINLSGMKVLPREVEEVIASLPGVVEVKVYPGKTQHGSLHVRAAVVIENGTDVARIKAHCEQHLVYYKRPSRITIMDALPKSANGKVLRDQLP